MIEQAQAQLETVGAGILRAVPVDGWRAASLHLTGAARMLEARLVVVADDGAEDRRQEIDKDTLRACHALRKAMYSEGSGTWYNAVITVNASRELESTFDYDGKPLDGHAVSELLVDDQAKYPRDPGHLPDWHPSRAAT
ncbi:hypothetical protein [Nocardioides speluncae]|uniref:hypothetical protein n=1 Tax=Nocardioides speluncae TaxID=2670337 RepID=UPI0012B17B5B|nr:hypothetical protein [Nocardioides speluncae]